MLWLFKAAHCLAFYFKHCSSFFFAKHNDWHWFITGKATISNDGATILKTLDIVHPAAKTLVDIAKSQDAEVFYFLSFVHFTYMCVMFNLIKSSKA